MSKVVFVGNVPYVLEEDELIDIFRPVGRVVGFRLVYDRETGCPRGYGFCEFADHASASSAVRKLDNISVGGRNLRVNLADSDPFMEGMTTVRGELLDGDETRKRWREGEKRDRDPEDDPVLQRPNDANNILCGLPPGIELPLGTSALDSISQTLATMNTAVLTEVLAQMKAFVISYPQQACTLLIARPQLAYALFQALLLNKIIDNAILQRMLAATTSGGETPANTIPMQQPQPMYRAPTNGPLANSAYLNMFSMPLTPPQQVPYYLPPPNQPTQLPRMPAQSGVQPDAPNIDMNQRDMIMQVLALSQEQVQALPQIERDTVHKLRNQFMGILGAA